MESAVPALVLFCILFGGALLACIVWETMKP